MRAAFRRNYTVTIAVGREPRLEQLSMASQREKAARFMDLSMRIGLLGDVIGRATHERLGKSGGQGVKKRKEKGKGKRKGRGKKRRREREKDSRRRRLTWAEARVGEGPHRGPSPS